MISLSPVSSPVVPKGSVTGWDSSLGGGWMIFYYLSPFRFLLIEIHYTFSISYIVSWVAARGLPRMLKVARSNPGSGWAAPIYTMHEALRGTAHEDGGCDQSIGSTVSDAIVRSWLWLTATMSFPLGCFSTLLQVVVNWPTFIGSRFSTGRLLAIEDFTNMLCLLLLYLIGF